ncbi:unnamed protein product [Peronospora belbahrii]|uniref:Uncharacterized protein n=1 Tax=Peronospora belbahrii TaxID=622444 RepID=A0AAU9L2G6_9STRA|nr:unnamed protein product [Peronospora belbahrii]
MAVLFGKKKEGVTLRPRIRRSTPLMDVGLAVILGAVTGVYIFKDTMQRWQVSEDKYTATAQKHKEVALDYNHALIFWFQVQTCIQDSYNAATFLAPFLAWREVAVRSYGKLSKFVGHRKELVYINKLMNKFKL